MYNDLDIAWFTGLFEGEGTFHIARETYAGGLAIQMTDLDVLERVQKIFGGKVVKSYEHLDKPHWKTCYKWTCSVREADKLIPLMLPLLSIRRTQRALEYLALREKVLQGKDSSAEKKNKIKQALSLGLSQRKVAKLNGVSQPYVNKIANT